VTTYVHLTPNINRSEAELKVLVKKAAKARTYHANLALLFMTVATFNVKEERTLTSIVSAQDWTEFVTTRRSPENITMQKNK